MLATHSPGFRVADLEHTDGRVRISISVDSDAATCLDCGRQSTAVHSIYVRQLRDLPILGEPVELQALVRRFRCRNSDCARITFSESLGWLAKRYAQRTDRVTDVLRSLVSMLSSTLSIILAYVIGIRTSSSTLLRAVDRSHCLASAPRVLGIDDFAIRRGRTYGTLLCDLETGRPMEGRMAEPVAQWISQHPGVEIVARDRATAYAQAVSSAAPGAIQVAYRFHLVRNVNDAFREVIDGRRRVIPGIAVDTVPEPCTKKPESPRRSEPARPGGLPRRSLLILARSMQASNLFGAQARSKAR